jgi:hypothetical protein
MFMNQNWDCRPIPPGVSLNLAVPASATFTHLHCDSNNPDFSVFYKDRKLAKGGADDDSQEGLEPYTVVYYAGEGNPYGWQSFGKGLQKSSVLIDATRLGDGCTRYQLMSGCNVMAHGPERPQSTARPGAAPLPYSCPECFRPVPRKCNSLSPEELGANVFERWRAHLGRGLRLACGGSTEIFGNTLPSGFWHYYSIADLPVADSFILAAAYKSRVGLCLTHGGRAVDRIAIWDQRFDPRPNLPESSYLYALYAVGPRPRVTASAQTLVDELGLVTVAGGEERPARDTKSWIPPALAVDSQSGPLTVARLDDAAPESLAYGFQRRAARFDGGHIEVSTHLLTRALVASFKPGPGSAGPERAAFVGPLGFLRGLAFAEKDDKRELAAPVLLYNLTTRLDRVRSADVRHGRHSCADVCDYIRLQKQVRVSGKFGDESLETFRIFGEAGEVLVRDCPIRPPECEDGTPFEAPVGSGEWSVALVDTRFKSTPIANEDVGRVVLSEPAVARAWQELEGLEREEKSRLEERFDKPTEEIGYLAAPAHCTQETFQPIHRFSFSPKQQDGRQAGGLIQVDVPFYRDSMDALQAEWSCSPAQPEMDASGRD